MRLRIILMVLSLLAFLSVSTGGYLYYAVLKESAFLEADRQTATRLEIIKKNLSSYLSENIRPVITLAGIREIRSFMENPTAQSLEEANAILDHFKSSLDVDVCYLMNSQGYTLASSNRGDPDSFVGRNFGFRPYFTTAIGGEPSTYLALGTTSGKRGAYTSHPVYSPDRARIEGVVVIKASIELIEKELGPAMDEIVLVTDPRGVVFISNRSAWLYHLLWRLNSTDVSEIAASLQFGAGPWQWIGLQIEDGKYAVDRAGVRYLMHTAEIDRFPGWTVIHLRSVEAISRTVSGPMIRITGPVVLALSVLVGLSVFFLYRKASLEIVGRKVAEEALRKSEERYRSIYNKTPAMLHSVDPGGRILSVSDHWTEVLGYSREEVIGRELTDFFTPQSRKLAREVVFPEFFNSGFCKDIPYRFIKKNGDTIDILLSAIGDRDEKGRIHRSLAVSIDVTERIRAEKDLQQAKEALSRYSMDLERQVRKRTSEISSILRYTPAVVYIKDLSGRYTLVNHRYEELFGVEGSSVRGKTDAEIMPPDIAEQFGRYDETVLQTGRHFQVEERIPQPDGLHTYLAVKFPIYDAATKTVIAGVCGIATDITAVKKAQDQLRRLSGSIMANQEKERAAIARELHDELGQVLTALRMDAVWLENRMKDIDPAAFERALTMSGLIDKTIDEVRGMAIRLRPGVLDDLGLVDALDWYTTDFEKRTGMACVFEHHRIPPVRDTVATAAYRIAQEALTNAARHAEASQVDVSLRVDGRLLTLSIQDDGKGFDGGDAATAEGLGLAGMRERAGLVGGSLSIDTQPGAGTRVRFSVSLEPENGGRS